jgi:WD repeat-containing protein 34
VSTWGIFRREFDPKKPTKTLEVSNCLTTIEFHPSDPLILAGGTLNGEIYLWNLDQEDPYLAHSAIDEYYHREAITKLVWVKYESLTSLAVSYCLMSVSTDAKILVWRLADKLRFPAKGHLLARKKDGEMSIVGGTSFARVGYGSGS